MNASRYFLLPVAGALLAARALPAADLTDDRIALSADGATLTGTDGGGGGSLTWLHNFDPDTLVAAAAEHQRIGDGDWTFGSLTGSLAHDWGSQHVGGYAEAHEGAGDDGLKAFHYRIEAVGITDTFSHRFTAILEDRRIDVESTHGSLPKLGLSYLWGPHVLTSVSFADSVGGNLGTRLTTARIDEYNGAMNFLGGVAFGPASPTIILNFQSGLAVPGRELHEAYVGAVRLFPRLRSELSVIADYQNLSGTKHATLTLNYTFHVGAAKTP